MLVNIILDFLLYSFSFLLFHYIQRKELMLNKLYLFYYLAFMVSWLVSSLLSSKFITKENNISSRIYPYFISFFLMLGLLTVITIEFNMLNVSRFVILCPLIFALVIELSVTTIRNRALVNFSIIKLIASGKAFLFDFFVYTLIIIYISLYKINYNGFEDKYDLLLVAMYIIWFIAAVFGHKFRPGIKRKNYCNFIWSYIIAYVIIISLNSFITFFLRLNPAELNIIIASTFIYIAISFSLITFVYFLRKPDISLGYRVKLIRANEYFDLKKDDHVFNNGHYRFSNLKSINSLNEKIKNIYLKKFPEVYDFLNFSLDIDSFNVYHSVILRSRDVYDIEILPDECLEFFLNLHETNDIRRLNNYFIEVNKKLARNGIFVGRIQTISLRYKKFLTKYPYYLGKILYFIDFIWHRLFPKIPILQKFYFIFSKGYNRAISFGEGMGRLYYCGFEVINLREIDNYIYFIAKKEREPSNDPSPSYGPLFKMRRIGLNGKLIYVYKLRTMHPYAEYLQSLIFEKFDLHEGGKFNNDFRITSWGKVLRKLWIDELPMIINFFKGELKLVGVRPLSSHYLSLYSDCVRERRKNYKPGLVPPFYVDMPKTLDEIMNSEIKYMDAYDGHPFATDVRYLFKAVYNILIKRARSR